MLVISNFLVPLHPIFGGLSVGLLNGDHKNRALKRAWCAEIWKISTEHRNGFVKDITAWTVYVLHFDRYFQNLRHPQRIRSMPFRHSIGSIILCSSAVPFLVYGLRVLKESIEKEDYIL